MTSNILVMITGGNFPVDVVIEQEQAKAPAPIHQDPLSHTTANTEPIQVETTWVETQRQRLPFPNTFMHAQELIIHSGQRLRIEETKE